jgi:hypothetical protein
VLQVHKDQLETLVRKDRKVHRVSLVLKDQLETLVHKVHKVHKVLQDHKVHKA